MAVLEVVDAVDVAGMTADRLVELDSDHGLIVRAVLREVADVQNRAVAIAVDPNPVADPVCAPGKRQERAPGCVCVGGRENKMP